MLELDFLEADEPLTKTFAKTGDDYEVTPYPFVTSVTSHRVEIASLSDMYQALQDQAKLGRCLVKGHLANQLVNQSRAGQTVSHQPTQYLVLDADFHEGWESIAHFVDELDPCLTGCSFIFQHSASAGIKGSAGLRGHIFILLNKPVAPLQLKTWLKIRNFQNPKLNHQIVLANNYITLKWPLDITTCQNDKLIYLHPPTCIGFDDPLDGQRFVLFERGPEQVNPPTVEPQHVALLKQWEDTKVSDLRQAMGMPRRKAKYKQAGDLEILTNPSPSVVTGYKTARGFTYINLNNGDSWAYYFPLDNPSIVYNFKGEPPVFLKDIAPEFAAQYQQTLAELRRKELVEQLGTDNFETLVFRDIVTDTYYNGYYFPAEDRVQIYKASSVQRLQHFKMQHNEEPPDFIEDYTVTFDPTRLEFYDGVRKWINNYNPSKYLRNPKLSSDDIPPLIDQVLDSVTGNDIDAKWHFINWLAYVYQTRKKAKTAWIFHGIEGTGKGLLFAKILRPLLGKEHVVAGSNRTIEDNFNDTIERANIVYIEELEMDAVKSAAQFMALMKIYVTEDYVMVRAMHKSARQMRNYWNFIIATNKQTPVYLSAKDRRFNVCPPQNKPLVMTTEEIDFGLEAELEQFAGFLAEYKVNVRKVAEVLHNDAREALVQSSQTTVDRFFEAARPPGNLNYFLSFLNSQNPMNDTYFYAAFEAVLERWCRHAMAGAFCNVPRDEIQTAYTYIMGRPIAAAKFQRMCSLFGLKTETVEVNGRFVSGYSCLWGGDKKAISKFLSTRTSTNHLKLVKPDEPDEEERKEELEEET